MDLRTYTNSLPRGGMSELAQRLGVSPIYLSQIAARQDGRVPSPTLCVDIEVATGKEVKRQDLRPDDWHRIWPELVDAEGAPKVQERAA